MTLLLAGLGVLVLGGLLSLLTGRNPRLATRIGVASGVIGSVAGLIAVAGPLAGSGFSASVSWHVPYGSLSLLVDPLAAFFLFVTFLLTPLAAWFGAGRVMAHLRERAGPIWLFFHLLVVSIALVLAAANAILFLVAWEVMTIAAFVLVTIEDERLEVRRAGWMFLVAAHLGTALLLVFFAVLGTANGSFDFALAPDWRSSSVLSPGWLFALALIGFGTKAGLVPLHVWLPEAHPAAPSYVSALMSGVMIATGIYGILRSLLLVGPLTPAWGEALIVLGAVTALVGVILALAQRDVKRVLAYSSVENMGIVLLAVGAGALGVATGARVLAELGFGAALLHFLNHACFKGLLFLSSGALRHATGTLDVDRLGGLLRGMPRTGTVFLIAAAAIIGLPPLNGFVSEFLVFIAGLHIARDLPVAMRWPGILLVVSLAAVGGLAAATFVKVFGGVFLGTARSERAAQAREIPAAMQAPLFVLAGLCVLLGVAPVVGVRISVMAVAGLSGLPYNADTSVLAGFGRVLTNVALLVWLGLGLTVLARWLLLRRREMRTADTWGCGYAVPVPRAQYTASSLVAPMVSFMGPVLPGEVTRVLPPRGYFPQSAELQAGTADLFTRRMYRPWFQWVSNTFRSLRALQHGRLQWYLLYVFLTLVVLLFIEFWQW
jgi:formate hydrogenlyase subunit 3/multisubunit Na+/H+ antiporter MnhD subunit